jgi:hypothetical protein
LLLFFLLNLLGGLLKYHSDSLKNTIYQVYSEHNWLAVNNEEKIVIPNLTRVQKDQLVGEVVKDPTKGSFLVELLKEIFPNSGKH